MPHFKKIKKNIKKVLTRCTTVVYFNCNVEQRYKGGGQTMSTYSDLLVLVEKLEKKNRAFIKALLREIEAQQLTLQDVAKKLNDFLSDTE